MPALPHGSDWGSGASSTMRIVPSSDDMDVDTAIGSPISAASGKRKLVDILPFGDEDGRSLSDGAFHPAAAASPSLFSNIRSFSNPSAPSASSPSAPSVSSTSFHRSVNPSKKKKTLLTHNSALAGPVTSSVAPSGSPSHIATKITPAVAIHGMQGSLNRLTDIMERNITLGPSRSNPSRPDSSSSLRTRAIVLLQTRNDNLTTSEKTRVIHKFTKDIELAEVYVALEDDELRQDWLQEMLRDSLEV